MDSGPHSQFSLAPRGLGTDLLPYQQGWAPLARDCRPVFISTCFPLFSEIKTLALLSQVLWARPHGGLGREES